MTPFYAALNNFRSFRGNSISTKEMDYQEYLDLQKLKSEDPERRKLWLGPEFDSKVRVFQKHFVEVIPLGFAQTSRVLCVGARTGQEVIALKNLGYSQTIGVDLVPFEPNVIYGDMHKLPFKRDEFSLVFSNCFDHSLYPSLFLSEVSRVLISGGYLILQIQLNKPLDKFGVTDVYSRKKFKELLEGFNVINERKIEMLSMNYEFILRKV